MSEPLEPATEHPTAEEMSVLAQFATLGITLASTVTVGLLLGLAFDHFAHTAPAGLIVGLILGSVGAASAMVSLIRRWM